MWRRRGYEDSHDARGPCSARDEADAAARQCDVAVAALRGAGGVTNWAALLDTICGVSGVSLPPAECSRRLAAVARLVTDAAFPSGNAALAARAMGALARQLGEPLSSRGDVAAVMEALVWLLLSRDDDTRLAAARCAGSVVFVCGERCAPWFERLFSALPLAPPLNAATRHAALVCCGNILRGGTRARELHVSVVAPVVAALSASCGDAVAADDADDAGRLLSSALRVLHCVLAAADVVALEAVAARGVEVVRALHTCATFGWVRASAQALAPSSPQSVRPPLRIVGSTKSSGPAVPPPPQWRAASPSTGGRDDANVGGATHRRLVTAVTAPAASSKRHSHVGAPGSWYSDSDDGDSDDGGEEGDSDDGGGGGWSGSAGPSHASRGSTHPRRIPIRIRVTALQCIGLLARAQPRLLQPRWAALVPEVQGLHPRPFAPSLLTIMLFDTSSRAREAAAGALAAVVAAAPLDKWIGGGAAPPSPAGTAPPRVPRTAFAGLSDKTAASLGELHAALERALHREMARSAPLPAAGGATRAAPATPSAVGAMRDAHEPSTLRHPVLVASILRAAAVTLASSPYNRLPALLARPLVARVVEVLALPAARKHPHVIVSALHAVGAALVPRSGCDTLLRDIPALTMPVGEKTDAAASGVEAEGALTQLVRKLTALDVTAEPPPRSAESMDWRAVRPDGEAPPALRLQPASRGAATLRPEVLAVISKAVRCAPDAVAAAWSDVGSLVLASFGDPVVAVRVMALKLLEDLLSARSAAVLERSVDGGGDGDGDGDTGGAAFAADVHGDAVMERAQTRRTELGALSTMHHGDRPRWPSLMSDGPITLSVLLRAHVVRAMRDPAPAVRAAAAAVVSYLLSEDWLDLLGSGGSAELQATCATVAAPRVRSDLLASIADACCDAAASVRVAAARVLGAYASYREWRSPAFLRLCARLLIGMLRDDSVSVRVKASWALGHVCTPPAMGTTVPTVFLPGLTPGDGPTAAVNFPAAGEAGPDALASLLPFAREPGAATAIRSAIAARCDTPALGGPVAPAELITPGASQSELAAQLTLPLLRAVTECVLVVVSSEQERVACTAVRTLGRCAHALMLHWLPIPVELRHTVDPVVIVTERVDAVLHGSSSGADHESDAAIIGTRIIHRPPARPRIVACPDDALIKASMLELADVVAMDSGEANLTAADGIPAAVALPPTPLHDDSATAATPLIAGAAAGTGMQRGPPARGPAVFSRPKPAAPTSAAPRAGTSPLVHVAAAAAVAASSAYEPVVGTSVAPTTIAAGTATHRPSGAAPHSAAAAAAMPGGGVIPAHLGGAGAAKVRWNACHAVALVLPLAHRLTCTHDEEWARRIAAPPALPRRIAAHSSPVPRAHTPPVVDGDDVTCAESQQGAAACSPTHASSALNSPPRPRVRRSSVSGSPTWHAGVDHVSTACTPFAPRGPPPADSGSAAASLPPSALVSGHPGAGPRCRLVPNSPAAGEEECVLVTDPTQPSVAIDATWIPPLLAALQAALTACPNFKVRIAAAQALALMPSRHAFRIPTPADADAAAGERLGGAGGHQGAAAGGAPRPSYLQPLLQAPGYDAYPSAFACLLDALERAATAEEDEAERRYRPVLLVTLRIALLHTAALAQRADYGHAREFLEAKAPVLVEWLEAEAESAARADGAAETPVPLGGTTCSLARAAATPTRAILPADVQAARAALAALFSRVKTIDAQLLARLRAGADSDDK